MTTSIYRKLGGFFVQESLDEEFYLLTCTGVGDISIPEGDETPAYCPSPSTVGDFIIDGSAEGEAGFVTFALNRPLQNTINYLLTELGKDCKFHGRVNWRNAGSMPDVPTNYIVAAHLHTCKVGNKTIAQPVILTAADDDRVETRADINAYTWRIVYPVTATRIAQTEVSAINGLAFDRSAECYTEEIGGSKIARYGYFTTDHTATSPGVSADIWYTNDYGVTWNLCTADPFAAAEDVGPVVTRGGRVIVGRITADGGPAEIAYSDNYGTTWSNVIVGAVNDQLVNALWWQDWTHLWAACTGGYVYFSADGGETWTAHTSGGVTAQNLLDIVAYDQRNVWATGASGAIIRTTDGENWELVTGPAAVADDFQTLWMVTSTRVLIGSDAGNMYRTNDGGATWSAALGTPQIASGDIRRIRGELDLRYFIYVVANTSAPVGQLYRSENGGASFQQWDVLDTNVGLNDLEVIDPNTAWTVGEPQGGTAFMDKIHQVS